MSGGSIEFSEYEESGQKSDAKCDNDTKVLSCRSTTFPSQHESIKTDHPGVRPIKAV